MTPTRRRTIVITLTCVTLATAVALTLEPVRSYAKFLLTKTRGGYTVSERIEQFGPDVAARVGTAFERAGLAYPPKELAYLAFKDSRLLEVYGRMSSDEPWRYVTEYAVLGASGSPGPKLMEGDKQVPEGIYSAQTFNPNSRFHLSIGLNYPNEFDRRMASRDGRTQLGGDIMIHGSSSSIGCLAMGDQAAEDLFVTAVRVGTEHLRVVIAPTDFRSTWPFRLKSGPAWIDSLYIDLHEELRQFQRRPAQKPG